MSLANDPTFTKDATGNLYGTSAGTTLNANTSVSQNFAFGTATGATAGYPGANGALSGRLQALNFGGATVNATNGMQVQLFSSSDGGTTYDTIPFGISEIIGTVVNTTTAKSWEIPPGYFKCTMLNLDPANAIKAALSLGTSA